MRFFVCDECGRDLGSNGVHLDCGGRGIERNTMHMLSPDEARAILASLDLAAHGSMPFALKSGVDKLAAMA